jgi:beta-lactamase class A
MRRLLVVLLAVGLLAACGDDDDGDGSAALAPQVTEAVEWYVGVLNGADPDATEYEARFAPSFRDQVALADFVAVSEQLRTVATDRWLVESLVAAGSEHHATGVLRSGGTAYSLSIQLEPDDPYRILGLLVSPVAPDVELGSLDELRDRVPSLAPSAGLLVAEVVDGSCRPLAEVDAGERVPIGSIFKLYVLGAVGQAVIDGTLSWDQPVTIRDELDSLPSGSTQDEPAGSTLPLEELARRMISVSDNTATDHLIDLVGREEVEAAQAALGHGDPSVNTPFLTTRELFLLKLARTDADRAAYVAASTDERRAQLAELTSQPLPDLRETSFLDPIANDTLEWFASPNELCGAHAGLAALAAQPGGEPIREILAVNPGLATDPSELSYVGFKGGSEPGVLALSWYLERADGRPFVLIATALDTEQPLDSSVEATYLAAVGLVGELP